MCIFICMCNVYMHMYVCMHMLRDRVVIGAEESRICTVVRNLPHSVFLSCTLPSPLNSYAQFVTLP